MNQPTLCCLSFVIFSLLFCCFFPVRQSRMVYLWLALLLHARYITVCVMLEFSFQSFLGLLWCIRFVSFCFFSSSAWVQTGCVLFSQIWYFNDFWLVEYWSIFHYCFLNDYTLARLSTSTRAFPNPSSNPRPTRFLKIWNWIIFMTQLVAAARWVGHFEESEISKALLFDFNFGSIIKYNSVDLFALPAAIGRYFRLCFLFLSFFQSRFLPRAKTFKNYSVGPLAFWSPSLVAFTLNFLFTAQTCIKTCQSNYFTKRIHRAIDNCACTISSRWLDLFIPTRVSTQMWYLYPFSFCLTHGHSFYWFWPFFLRPLLALSLAKPWITL